MGKNITFLWLFLLGFSVFSVQGQEKVQKLNVMKTDTVFVERIPLQKTKRQDSIPVVKKEKNPIFGYDFFDNNSILFSPDLSIPVPKDYTIGIGDKLTVETWGASENSFTTQVDSQGNIFIKGVGKINVLGLTFDTAITKINSHLKKIFSGISAPEHSYGKVYTSVSLSEVRSININIIGEVKTPGTYTLNALSNVLSALYASGGPSQMGSFREVKLIRKGKEIAVFDIYKYLLNGDETGNLSLQNQDLIIVPPYKNRITVQGEVKRPGVYEMLSDETLSDLIEYFGGFLPDAYTKLLTLERVSGSKRMVEEISHSKYDSFTLVAGDKLFVNKLDSDYVNKVEILGAVYQPGKYQIQEGITLIQLIEKANGLKKNAFLDKTLIYRTENLTDYKIIAVSLKDIFSGKVPSPTLQNNDRVQIFSEGDLKRKQNIRIEGAVNEPKTLDFVENMTITDVIALSGGFKDGADKNNIIISRQQNNGNFEDISKTYVVSLSDTIKIQPKDIINVRYIKGYTPLQMVQIKGEVAYPGVYTILSKSETVYDIIDRAGGLSPFADKKGITVIRQGEKDDSEVLEQNSSGVVSLNQSGIKKYEYTIGIPFNEKANQSKLILKDGDIIVIPEQKQTVQVKGLVLSPSLIQYQKGMSALDYINRSGGFANNAKKRALYVIYANGSIKSAKNYLLFTSYPTIEPGAIVVVPEKEPSRPITVQETVSTMTSITTLGLLIYNIFK